MCWCFTCFSLEAAAGMQVGDAEAALGKQGGVLLATRNAPTEGLYVVGSTNRLNAEGGNL